MTNEIKDFLEITIFNVSVKRILIFFAIIFIFQIFKKIFVKTVISFIHTFTKKTKNKIDDNLLNIVDKPFRFMFSITGFYVAYISLNLPKNNPIEDGFFLTIKTLFIFSIFWALYRAEETINLLVRKKFQSNPEIAESFLPLFNKAVRLIIFVVGATVIIQLWGYNIGALITGLGIGGLAIALAAKDTLANFFGSIMILFDKPFKIGDWIICDGIEGIVEDIGFRTTRIRTFSKALVSIPNAHVSTNATINWSRRDRRRIKYSIGVTYSTTRSQMIEAVTKINEMLKNHEQIHNESLMVYFDEFADSSMNIFVYCFTKTSNWEKYLQIKQDVNLKIMEIFEEIGIEFAFPSMSVYLENSTP
jgi:MscS family membrane protein